MPKTSSALRLQASLDDWNLFGKKGEQMQAKYTLDKDGRKRSHHMALRLFYTDILSDDLPSLILSLDYHCNLRTKFYARFPKTFRKGKAHLKRSDEWIAKNDSAAMKAHKTHYILQLLKSVDEECFKDHETHYKCPGFFKELEFLEIETKSCSLLVLSTKDQLALKEWIFYADRGFVVRNYPREESLSDTKQAVE
jgi:hypothetical protein